MSVTEKAPSNRCAGCLDVCNHAVAVDQLITLLEFVKLNAFDAEFERKMPMESALIHATASQVIFEWRELKKKIDKANSEDPPKPALRPVSSM